MKQGESVAALLQKTHPVGCPLAVGREKRSAQGSGGPSARPDITAKTAVPPFLPTKRGGRTPSSLSFLPETLKSFSSVN